MYGEASGVAEGILLADKLGKLLFKLDVEVECAVQEARTGAARAILLHGLDARLDDAVVAGEARVGIRTEHQHMVSAHFNFCSLFAFDGPEIGVHAFRLVFLRQGVLR